MMYLSFPYIYTYRDVSLENVMLNKQAGGDPSSSCCSYTTNNVCQLIDLEMARYCPPTSAGTPPCGVDNEEEEETVVLVVEQEGDEDMFVLDDDAATVTPEQQQSSSYRHHHCAAAGAATAAASATEQADTKQQHCSSSSSSSSSSTTTTTMRKFAGGKPGYVDPCVVDGTVEDWYTADIWSLAICLYVLLTGR